MYFPSSVPLSSLMIQQVYLQFLLSYLVHGTHCAQPGRNLCTWGVLHVLNCITHAVLCLGVGDSGWSQMPSIVTGKIVPIFQAGPRNLASDCDRETSMGEASGCILEAQWCFSVEFRIPHGCRPACNVRLARTVFLRPFECCAKDSCQTTRAVHCPSC